MARRAPLYIILSILVACLVLQPSEVLAQTKGYMPLGMQLSWQQDPTSTMTIDWHVMPRDESIPLQYRRQGEEIWHTFTGTSYEFPFSERIIRRAELTGLIPDATYEFRIGEHGRRLLFRTMPHTALRPIRIAVGGDVRHRQEWMDRTNRVAASYSPDFVLFGGDLAYVDGDPRKIGRWYEWFESTMTTLVAPSGRMIPVLAAIGNHEVWHNRFADSERDPAGFIQRHGLRERTATFFYDLFPFPGHMGYGVLDFGDYMSVLLLDTDHIRPIIGEQTTWLEEVLSHRRHVPHIFPVYHQPAYPSVRQFGETSSARVREHWSPLFERYGVRLAFENHDHAYKRTYPIRRGEVDPGGVVYVGDGAWGVSTREIGMQHSEPAWYLAHAKSVRHFILLTVQGTHQHFVVVDENGAIIDEYPAQALSLAADMPIGTLEIFPNPASGSVQISFSTLENRHAAVYVYDTLGRRVATAMEPTVLAPGEHSLSFDTRVLRTGTYLVRLEGDERVKVRRLTVLP